MSQTEKADRAPSNRLPQKLAHSGDGGTEARNPSNILVGKKIAWVGWICVGILFMN
jgi:hypothetical protein